MRVSQTQRRDALLDAAVALVEDGGADAVSMDAVAERAKVSRPLVYKHFANREELLVAVYQREALDLHDRLAADVAAATTVEGMFNVLIRGSLQAMADRGPVFAALRSAAGRSRELRRAQRDRDARTVRAFAARLVREIGVDRRRAVAAIAVLLNGIDPLLQQWRLRPSNDTAALLEDSYMAIVRGTLQQLRPQ